MCRPGRRQLVADLFRRTAERAHGDHNAEHGGDNSQTWQGIGHAAQRGDGQTSPVVMDLYVEIQELVKVKGFDTADGHAHGIAEIVADVVILEEGGILGEKWTFGGILDVALQRHQALTARLVKEFIHHFEGVEVALFGEFGSSEHARNPSHDFFQNVKGVGNQYRADGSASNDHQLSRLDQDHDLAMFHQVAAYHRAEDDYDSDNCKHRGSDLRASLAGLRASRGQFGESLFQRVLRPLQQGIDGVPALSGSVARRSRDR